MKNATVWAERIREWRASQLTSEEYCEGKAYSAGALRQWAHQLGMVRRRTQPTIRMAAVLRVSSSQRRQGVEPLLVECGGVRVTVKPGFDRETLAAVLDIAGARGAAR